MEEILFFTRTHAEHAGHLALTFRPEVQDAYRRDALAFEKAFEELRCTIWTSCIASNPYWQRNGTREVASATFFHDSGPRSGSLGIRRDFGNHSAFMVGRRPNPQQKRGIPEHSPVNTLHCSRFP